MKAVILATGILLSLQGLLVPVCAYDNNPLNGLHQDIQSELEGEEPMLLPKVDILWRHAINRNPTLQLALQKMAEKTGEVKPAEKASWTRKMLNSAVQLGGFGGAVLVGNAAPLVGSAVLGKFTAPDTAAAQLTNVTGADLVILAREIEQTQSQLISSYLDYQHAREDVMNAQRNLDQVQAKAKTLPPEVPGVSDALQTLAIQNTLKLQQAKSTLQYHRSLLVLLTGEQAVAEVDRLLDNPQPEDKSTETHAKPQSVQPPAG